MTACGHRRSTGCCRRGRWRCSSLCGRRRAFWWRTTARRSSGWRGGRFREAPAGAALLDPEIAVYGAPEAVRAAAARRKAGRISAAWLLDRAEEPAGRGAVWVVARGGVAYPLPGDAANLNRLLQLVEYGTLAVRLGPGVEIDAAAVGRDAGAARHFEESLRALFSFAAAGAGRDRKLAALLNGVEVRREGLTVRASITADPGQVATLLGIGLK